MLSKGIILLIVSIVLVVSTPVLSSVAGTLYGIAAKTVKKAKSIVYDEHTRTESSEKSELLDELWWSDKGHSKEEREKVYVQLYRSFLKDSTEKAKKIEYLEQKRSNYNFEVKSLVAFFTDLIGLEYFFEIAIGVIVKIITSVCVFLMDRTIKQENWEPLSEIDNACDLVFAHEFFKNNYWFLDKENENNREKILPETITLSNENKEQITRKARICYGWKEVDEEFKYLEIHLISYKLHWFSKKATIFVFKRLDRNENPIIGNIKSGFRELAQKATGTEEKRPSMFITRITVKLGASNVFNRWHLIDFVVKFIAYLLP